MNTNQIAGIETSNLSAASNSEQNNTLTSNNVNHANAECKTHDTNNKPFSKSHECSNGVCGITWKPSHQVA